MKAIRIGIGIGGQFIIWIAQAAFRIVRIVNRIFIDRAEIVQEIGPNHRPRPEHEWRNVSGGFEPWKHW